MPYPLTAIQFYAEFEQGPGRRDTVTVALVTWAAEPEVLAVVTVPDNGWVGYSRHIHGPECGARP